MNLAVDVCKIVEVKYADKIPTVEEIQDIVEKVLIENGHAKQQRHIFYRYERTRSREMNTNLEGSYGLDI